MKLDNTVSPSTTQKIYQFQKLSNKALVSRLGFQLRPTSPLDQITELILTITGTNPLSAAGNSYVLGIRALRVRFYLEQIHDCICHLEQMTLLTDYSNFDLTIALRHLIVEFVPTNILKRGTPLLIACIIARIGITDFCDGKY